MSSNYLFDELNNLAVEFPKKKREYSIAYVPKKKSKEKLQEMVNFFDEKNKSQEEKSCQM